MSIAFIDVQQWQMSKIKVLKDTRGQEMTPTMDP